MFSNGVVEHSRFVGSFVSPACASIPGYENKKVKRSFNLLTLFTFYFLLFTFYFFLLPFSLALNDLDTLWRRDLEQACLQGRVTLDV